VIDGKGGHVDLKEAVAVAKRQVSDLFADPPQAMRLEEYLYDDHLGVWSLTIGFALSGSPHEAANSSRGFKIVRVSQADKSILSIRDR
jgi:hypothetical protein